MTLRPTQKFGTPIPSADPHAVSVEYPTWSQFNALVEGDKALAEQCPIGYPRFTVHPSILQLEKLFLRNKPSGIACSIFPSKEVADRCKQYVEKYGETHNFELQLASTRLPSQFECAYIAVLYFPEDALEAARQYWAIFGEGISSRHAEYFIKFGFEPENTNEDPLNPEFAKSAKDEIYQRLANISAVGREDIYLFPTGMAALFHAHLVFERLTLAVSQEFPAVLYGFAFKDTPKLLSRWGTGLKWYPNGTDDELDELEKYLQSNRISGLFCEVPSNPVLRTPNLERIKALAEKYNFLVGIDDTLGNMINVNALNYCDVTVTSLTKVFSGGCNVMAGSLQISPSSSNKDLIKPAISELYQDNIWAEDAVVLNENSRDVVARAQLTNRNTEAVLPLFENSPLIKHVYYPSLSDTKENYDLVRTEDGDYGSLLTLEFKNSANAAKFYDALDTLKGPSLGVNGTLCIPYALGAHHDDLEVPEKAGISRYIIRISIGTEPIDELKDLITNALSACS